MEVHLSSRYKTELKQIYKKVCFYPLHCFVSQACEKLKLSKIKRAQYNQSIHDIYGDDNVSNYKFKIPSHLYYCEKTKQKFT